MSLNALSICLEAPLTHGARDPHTRHKVFARDAAGCIWLPATTLQGALRHHLGLAAEGLTTSGACVLLLPVRALDAPSVWTARTDTLAALARVLPDGDRLPPLDLSPGVARTTFTGHMQDALMLEERTFERAGALPDAWVEALVGLLPHASTRARARGHLVVLHPHDHAWLTRHTTPLVTRNSLHERKRLATHWHEERLPRDTLLLATCDGALPEAARAGEALVRMGGGESLGLGWASVLAGEAREVLETPALEGRPTAFAHALPAPFDAVTRVPGAVFDVRVSALALQLHTELRAAGLGATLVRLLRGTSGAHGQLRMLLTGMAGEASLSRLGAMSQDEYVALHDQLDAALASIALNQLQS